MRFRCTVTNGHVGTDVIVTCLADDTVGDVLDLINAAVGTTGTPTLAGIPLRRDRPILDSGLRAGALLTYQPTRAPGRTSVGDMVLQVVGGVHAGREVDLPPNVPVLVGKTPSPSNGPTLALPLDGQVSRCHAVVLWDGRTVSVRDVGSSNGTVLYGPDEIEPGRPLAKAGAPTLWPADHRLRVGRSWLAAQRADGVHRTLTSDGDLLVSPAPRVLISSPTDEVVLPPRPQGQSTRGGAQAQWILPLLMLVAGVVMAVLLHQPAFLLFALLSPITWLVTRFTTRRADRLMGQDQVATHEGQVERARLRFVALAGREDLAAHARWPDPDTVLRTAVEQRAGLWGRRAGGENWLDVRLGSRNRPATVPVRGDASGLPGWPPVSLAGAPETVSLTAHPVLGVTEDAVPTAAWVVLQAAVLHAPDQLGIAVIASEHAELGWARWLPHLRTPGPTIAAAWHDDEIDPLLRRLLDIVDARQKVAVPQRSAPLPEILVVVVDVHRIAGRTAWQRLLDSGPSVGLRFVCTAPDPVRVPTECTAVLTVSGDRATLRTAAGTVPDIAPDRWAAPDLDRAARAVAALNVVSGRTATAHIPNLVRLGDLAGLPSVAELRSTWQRRPERTDVPIGIGETGTTFVDILDHGPHGVVVGTIGSGKSEFLTTMLLELAIANTPEYLNFLFVDYKGDGTFGPLAGLPHVVGYASNSDNSAAPERVLDALSAELERRQRQLTTAKVGNIRDYRALPEPKPSFPRLLVMVDEFTVLTEQVPDANDRIKQIALTGRSAGVHLILATQPPARIDRAILDNADLKVALRVSESYSRDIIGVPDAGRIGQRQPGRAMVKLFDQVREVQTAWASAPASDTALVRHAQRLEWAATVEPEPPRTAAATGPTELSRLVELVTAAAGDRRPPYRSWHDPLPPVVTIADVPIGPAELVIGRSDLPQRQSQPPLALAAGTDHLAIIGGAQSGRTTALRAIAVGLAEHARPDQVHVHVIDSGGDLAGLAELPHVGVVATAGQRERVTRLLSRLVELLDQRRQVRARSGAASVAELWRSGATDAPAHVVLMIDGADPVRNDPDNDELFGRLCREGVAEGITICMTIRDIDARPGVVKPFVHQLVFRKSNLTGLDTSDLGMPRQWCAPSVPGRAWWRADPREVQVPLLTADPSGSAQRAALATIAKDLARQYPASTAARMPLRIDALPDRISLADSLRDHPDTRGRRALVGVGGDRTTGLWVDVLGEHRRFVVAGASRSGRSTALRAMAISLSAQGLRVVLIGDGRSVDTRVVSCDAPAAATTLAAGADVVLIDDIDRPNLDQQLGQPVLAVLASQGGPAMIAAVEAAQSLSYNRVATAIGLTRARAGLLLSDKRGRTDFLGVSFGRAVGDYPPGRGFLVVDGTIVMCQVAMPTPDDGRR